MKQLTPTDAETHSADIVADNIMQLKTLFPEAFTEGKVHFEVLKQLLGGTLDEREEKYGVNWHGKRRARQLALTPSAGTLRPCPKESVDWSTTQNLMVEGDNLEVLKLLQKSYAGKVKLVYIDPPYNTGTDFVYPDNFQDNIKNYLELTGQLEGGQKISSNTEASGRFHTDWLNMMYPRLKLARTLLREDGIIFISIDDNEVGSLRSLCDDIFGEENFIATIIWEKSYAPRNNAPLFSVSHEYVVVYAKQAEIVAVARLKASEEQLARYKNPDDDPRGLWKAGDMTVSLVSGQRGRTYQQTGKGANLYSIKTPSGRTVTAPPGRCWVYSEEKFKQLVEDKRVWWGTEGNNVPSLKRFLNEIEGGQVPQTLWSYDEVGHTQEATKDLKDLFPDAPDSAFPTPKPTRLIRRMLDVASNATSNDIILDFFGGSGTTGHAVFAQNISDGGNRRFIIVQLPEPTERKDYATISAITKERLRRAAKKFKVDNPQFAGDLGFRVFKLDSSNIRAWEPDRDNLPKTLEESVEHLKASRTEDDILYELLLKLGLNLCVPIEQRKIAGKAVHSVGGGVLLACLDTKITQSEIEALAQGIVAWHKTLSPAGDSTCVFRDSAFADDVAKTNLAAILNQHGLTNVRSL